MDNGAMSSDWKYTCTPPQLDTSMREWRHEERLKRESMEVKPIGIMPPARKFNEKVVLELKTWGGGNEDGKAEQKKAEGMVLHMTDIFTMWH